MLTCVKGKVHLTFVLLTHLFKLTVLRLDQSLQLLHFLQGFLYVERVKHYENDTSAFSC